MCFSWRPKLIDLECYFKTIKCPHLDENVQAVKVLYNIKISKSKHQITNKSQITIFNDQNSHRLHLCRKGLFQKMKVQRSSFQCSVFIFLVLPGQKQLSAYAGYPLG